MRILVINKGKHKNSYNTCIQTLIEEISRRHDYQVMFIDNFKDSLLTSKVITIITLPPVSFFDKLLQQQRLSSFIQKNKIDLVIQNAGFIIKQKSIQQLIIARDLD